MTELRENSQASTTILVVERDQNLLNLNRLVLEYAGYRVVWTQGHENAVDLAENFSPAAIIIGIPKDDVSAIDVVARLREHPATEAIPIVVAAFPDNLAAAASAVANMRDVVIAPYGIGALKRAVQTAARKRSSP
jgi:DNA-binding response OmpR family regulator